MRSKLVGWVVAGTLIAGLALGGCAAASSGSGSGSGSSSAGASSGATAASLISDRCTRCHPVDRIKAAQHDATAWAATIARMRSRGANLTDSEAQQVVEFLAGGGGSKL